MTVNPIPDDLREFILSTIDSVAEMEALLLLRSDTEQDLGVQFFSRRLYINDMEAAAVLQGLCEKGLAAMVPGDPVRYCFGAQSPELRLLMDRLLEAYARHMVAVTNIIHSKPHPSIRAFAMAFKFRKD